MSETGAAEDGGGADGAARRGATKIGLLRFATRTALYFTLMFTVLSLDFFGLDNVSLKHSTVFLSRVFGQLEGMGPPAAFEPPDQMIVDERFLSGGEPCSSLQDDIAASRAAAKAVAAPVDGVSVVYIDQATLDLMPDWHWPFPLHGHAELLDIIRENQPRAVVLDLLFIDQRPAFRRVGCASCGDDCEDCRQAVEVDPTAELNEQITLYGCSGIPLFFGVNRDGVVRPDLKVHDRNKVLVSVNLPDQGRIFPDSEYFMSYPDQVAAQGGPGKTMAFEVYNRTRPESAPALPDIPRHLPGHLELVWDRAGDQSNLIVQKKCGEDFGMFARLALAVMNPETLFQPCLPFPTYPALALLGGGTEEQVETLIRDRVVYIGTTLSGTGDFIYSPVHGRLPGVIGHAMAHHNLLTLGSDHKKRAFLAPGFGTHLPIQWLEAALIFGLTVIMMACFPSQAARARERKAALDAEQPVARSKPFIHPETARFLKYFAYAIIFIASSLTISFYFFDTFYIDWIQLLGAIGLGSALASNNLIEKYTEKCVEPFFGARLERKESHSQND